MGGTIIESLPPVRLSPALHPMPVPMLGRQQDVVIDSFLHEGAYSLEELRQAFHGEVGDLVELFPDRTEATDLVLSHNTHFFLRDRAKHVLEEAARVRAFKVSWW